MKLRPAISLSLCVLAIACGDDTYPSPIEPPKPAAPTALPRPSAAPPAATVKPFSVAPDAPGPVVLAVKDAGLYVFHEGKLTATDVPRASRAYQTKGGHVIVQYDPSFPHALTPEGKLEKLHAWMGTSAPAKDGSIYVIDSGPPSGVRRIDNLDAKERDKSPPEAAPIVGDDSPTHIAIDAQGNLHLASSKTLLVRRGKDWKTVKASELSKSEDPRIQGLLNVGDEVYAVIERAAYNADGKKLALPPTTAGVVYVEGAPVVSVAGDVAFHTGLELVVVHPDGKSEARGVESFGVKGARFSHGAAIDGQGRRWLGTDGGLIIISKDNKVLQVWPPGTLPGPVTLVYVVGAGPELGSAPPPAIKGNVKGRLVVDGTPLANAEMLACHTPASVITGPNPCSGAAAVLSGKTDAGGVFHFTDVPAWSYGFAFKIDNQWKVTLGTTLGQCCGRVQPDKELDIGDVHVKNR